MSTGKSGLKTVVFLGSVREGRMGLRVATFIMKQLEAANHVVELFGRLTLRLQYRQDRPLCNAEIRDRDSA